MMGVVNFSLMMSWRDKDAEFGNDFERQKNFPNVSEEETLRSRAASYRYLAAAHLFYPVLTLSVVFTMNTLLQRVSDHASHPYYNTVRDRNHVEDDDIKRFDCRDCIGEYALYCPTPNKYTAFVY